MANITELIQDNIIDPDFRKNQLVNDYLQAKKKERKAMDRLMINLTGYTLAAFIHSADDVTETIEKCGFGYIPSNINT